MYQFYNFSCYFRLQYIFPISNLSEMYQFCIEASKVTWKIWPIIWHTSYPFQVEDEIAKSNSLQKTIIVGFYVYKIGMVKHFALMPPKFLIRQLVLKLILTIGQHLVYLWTCLCLSYKMIFLLQVCTQHKQIQPLFTKQQVLSIHSHHQTGKLLLPGYSKDGL